MFNESTFISMLVFIFIIGNFTGAFIYIFIQNKFVNNLEKRIQDNMKNYEHIVLENTDKIIDEFEEFIETSKKLSNDTLTIQNEILNVNTITKNQFDNFFEEINQAQIIKFRLENEIVKLKNIIKRQNNKGEK
jgi:mevalonate kinase